MKENIRERTAGLLEIMSVTATLVCAVFAVLHYVHDIKKIKNKKATTHAKVKGCFFN